MHCDSLHCFDDQAAIGNHITALAPGRTRLLIVIPVAGETPRVDHPAVLRERNVDAGATFAVDYLDRLRLGIVVLTAMVHGLEPEAGAVKDRGNPPRLNLARLLLRRGSDGIGDAGSSRSERL
jgi:hypothetical protein